ncbi:tetratricopeptide repeat protein, partial [Acinetobacter sp. ABJ-A23_2]|uniref:tetratricopeptide repeat protein n=1 Tax=Acinetobacter sp. ABJ-A23_2 TaxID=3376991 RepID=UPI0037C5DED0
YIRDEILGNYYFYKRDFNNAIHFFKKVLKSDPNAKLSRYHYLSGIGYERLKKYDDAFAHYVESIDIDPIFVDPYIDLGGMLGKLHEYEKAAKCYRDAIKITPNDITLYLNLKMVLQKMNLSSVENQNELKNIENEIKRLEVLGIKAPPMNNW